ncbi:MAG: alpha/beta hydrolase [Solirubrobacterales bacterium]|nr:alpha/beta hydrolase [Solirubrobacterales bacterium]
MPRLEVEPGVELFYRDLGHGRPVVLVHGWTMSHRVWDSVVQRLAGRYRMVLPDLRGHGDSDKPIGDYSPARHAADLGALMEGLDLRDVTLLGWSFGGMAVMQAAATHPARLAQAVLLNAAGPRYLRGDGFPHGHDPDDLAAWLRRERDEPVPWRRFCMESMPARAYDPLFTDWLWAESMRTPSWAAAPMLDAFARADLRADVEAISVPLLVLHGAHDTWCLPEAARYVADRAPRGELALFADAGHSPQWEESDALHAVLDEFLARVSP